MKTITKALIVAIAIPLSTSMVMAQSNNEGRMHDGMSGKRKQSMMRIYKELDLTNEQSQKIKDLYKSAKHNNMKGKRDSRSEIRDEWQALMQAESFDRAKATALINKKNAKKLENELARAKTRYDAYQVLNAEQKAKFNEIVKAKYQNKRSKQY